MRIEVLIGYKKRVSASRKKE